MSARSTVMAKLLGVRDMVVEHLHTMDIPELLRYDLHFVFVYGTLKYQFPRFSVLEEHGAKFQGIATTEDSEYELVSSPFGFPVALWRSGNKKAYAPLKGELYAVPTKAILALDDLEGNGRMFYRENIDVNIIRTNKVGREVLPCFTYLGLKRFWKDYLPQCKDIPLRGKEEEPYYIYTKADFMHSQPARNVA